jgi:hypothetical protein
MKAEWAGSSVLFSEVMAEAPVQSEFMKILFIIKLLLLKDAHFSYHKQGLIPLETAL